MERYASSLSKNHTQNDFFNSLLGNILFSSNDGRSWDSITKVSGITLDSESSFMGIYGNRDSLVATIYLTGLTDSGYKVFLVYSTDLGRSWQSSLIDQIYQYGTIGLHVSPHSCNIIRQLTNYLDDTYSFFLASPSYTNWNSIFDHIETGAWIAGNECAYYLSDANPSSGAIDTPIYRSTNQGLSWRSILPAPLGGPNEIEIDDGDWQNLSVVGYGAVVYAGNSSNVNGAPYQLWKTTDGGDGTLSAAALAPKLALAHVPFPSGNDTLHISSCEASQMVVTNFNIGCSWATFDSVTIEGLGSSEYSVTSTHYCGCTHVPDSSFITLEPKQPGIHNVTVHFHYTDDEFNQIDTTLPVVLDIKSGGAAVPMSLTLGAGTITARAGDTIEIPVYLTSDSTITLAGPVQISLPFAIDTSVLRSVGFVSDIMGLSETDSMLSDNTLGIYLLSSGNIPVIGRTLVGTLRCVVYLADTLSTSVSLAGASINAGTGGCVALSTELSGVNIAITGCGDSTLLKFMRTGTVALAIDRIIPNPASGSLRVEGRGQRVAAQVVDALGRIVIPLTHYPLPFTLDVSALPNGIYLLEAESPEGFVASRKFIVDR